MAATLATVERLSSRRTALRAELGTLDAAALAARLELIADEVAELQAGLVYGTRRLAALAAAASRSADERLDIEGVMALLGRSRSWVEHHGRELPGRCQRTRGARVTWQKSALVRHLAAGGC